MGEGNMDSLQAESIHYHVATGLHASRACA